MSLKVNVLQIVMQATNSNTIENNWSLFQNKGPAMPTLESLSATAPDRVSSEQDHQHAGGGQATHSDIEPAPMLGGSQQATDRHAKTGPKRN